MSQDATWSAEMSEVYDRCLGPALFQPYADHLAGLAARLRPSRVLELAAGTGIVTRALVQALPGAQVTASDLNAGMVDYGREQVGAADWQVVDAQALPFPDVSFDLVVCQFGFMFFPDKPGAAREMARVLRPGGSVLIAVWDAVEHSPLSAALVAALAEVLPDDTPDFVVRTPFGYHDPERFAADLRAGGLVVDSVERVVLRSESPSAAAFAEGYCKGVPLRFALEQRGSLDALTTDVTDSLQTALGPGELSADMAAYVATAHT